MTIENSSPQPAPQESPNFFELLGRLNTVTPEQINALRAKVSTNYQGFFDTKVSYGDKQILTLLDNLSDAELLALVKMGKKQGGRLVGFHEVGGHLHTLQLLTGNERYGKIVKESQNSE